MRITIVAVSAPALSQLAAFWQELASAGGCRTGRRAACAQKKRRENDAHDAAHGADDGERLAFAKGALLSLLEQAYCRRDYVGLIVFGDKKAQLVLPFN